MKKEVMILMLCGVVIGSVGAYAAELTLQTSIDVTAVTANLPDDEGLGYAAVGFDGTTYWVAKWASATISRITLAGALVDTFEIAGLTGTRSFTWDGTKFWVGNASTTITCVDPATKTLCGTITAPDTARYVTYDPTADGGNGGFWIGNFNTDILQIDMAGNTLVTIPAATMPNITGRYGAAFDNVTDVGPILWLFHQGGGASTCELTAIDLPSGAPRSSTQSLMPSVPSMTSCLAGGAFLGQSPSLPGGISLLTLLQGTPDNYLLGFEPAPTFPVELEHFSVD